MNRVLALVRRIHQLHLEARLIPQLLNLARRHACVQLHSYLTNPESTATGIEMLPGAINVATTAAPLRSIGV